MGNIICLSTMRPLIQRPDLPVGQMLLFVGYGDHKYVITGKTGNVYNTVNLDTWKERRQNCISMLPIAEKKDGRIQVYILEEVQDAEFVANALTNAAIQKEIDAKAAADSITAREKQRLELLEKYRHLIQGQGRVIAAKNIRTELKDAFKGIKFSVTSDSYSGGNSVSINWTDGPCQEAVEKITGKYQEGSFDGMHDLYEYGNALFPEMFGGAKYVHESRRISDEKENLVAAEMGYPGHPYNPKTGEFEGLDNDQSQRIHREAWKRSF